MVDQQLNHTLFFGGALIAGAVGIDYILNGDNSILGKILNPPKPGPIQYRSDVPAKFGEPSTSPYEVPVKTLRAPIPESEADRSGRLAVPMNYPKEVKGSLTQVDMEIAAEEVARVVFEDVSVYDPGTKFKVGDTRTIKENLLMLMHGPDAPEILLKLAKFHADHQHEVIKPGGVLYQQQLKMVWTAADAYEAMIGVQRMYSRTGDENAHEYDSQDDRLAAAAAESPIFFRVQNAWPAY